MIGLSVGGLAAVVATVLVILSMTVWAGLDRKDYELAASFTDTSTGFFASIVVKTDFALLATRDGGSVEEEVAAAHESAAQFNDHVDGLSGLPAVTDDPEIAALFEEFEATFNANRDRVLTVADASIPFGEYYQACHGQSSDPISQMRLGMSSAELDQVMAEFDQSQVACTEALQSVAEGDHEWSREHAEPLLELWTPVRDATEQVGRAGVANDQAAIQEATETLTAARDELGTAQAEFDEGFRDLIDDDLRSSQESSDALIAALEAKMEES